MKKTILIVITCLLICSSVVLSETELSDMQRNSITMLNYLRAIAKEINDSKESRLFLENTYDLLFDNINPSAVDAETQSQLNMMSDTLHRYRMLDQKRSRLAYIYDQNQARAIKNAIPNPLGLISMAESGDILKTIASLVYMAVDAKSSYDSYVEENELQYLENRWELDDEEMEEVHSSRKMAFNYMIDMVREYDLPGWLALNESAIDDFISAKNNPNVHQRIHLLETSQKTYEGYANYWIVLAESYYEAGDYKKCLETTEKYISLNNNILRFDYDLAKELPMAINAAKEVYDTSEYVNAAIKYAELIIENAGAKNWALRYFVAQTYMDLYSITKNQDFLQKAYKTALDNIVFLIPSQKKLNTSYLSPIQKVDIPDSLKKAEEKEERKQYNKMLEETRKTELPPVYEPLLINLELLFELMDKMGVDDLERERIDLLLHGNGEKLFLNESLENNFRFSPTTRDNYVPLYFEKEEIIRIGDKKSSVLTLPAYLVTDNSLITVIVTDSDKSWTYSDWSVDKVIRKTEGDIESFEVIYKSSSIGSQNYTKQSRVNINVETNEGNNTFTNKFWFYVLRVKNALGAQNIKFSGPFFSK